MMNTVQKAGSRLRDRLSARGLIFMYHRVAEPDLDPWGLSVSPRHFAEQLDVINKYFRPLSMRELLQCIELGKVPNRSIVVTFDDGYADNLHNAKPLLERYGVPATIYLVTEALIEERNFWWDELEWVLTQTGTLPETLELKTNGNRSVWQLGNAREYSNEDRQKDHQRRPWDALPGTRLAFFYQVWQQLQKLSKLERLEAIQAIREWAGTAQDDRHINAILSKEEVHTLVQGGLIEVGAHTMTHPSLNALSMEQQRQEIVGSKIQLEDILGHSVTSFSYPHGEYSDETIDLVREAGFHGATTTNFKCVFSNEDPFQLPRFQVDNWGGDEFLRRLIKWYALY